MTAVLRWGVGIGAATLTVGLSMAMPSALGVAAADAGIDRVVAESDTGHPNARSAPAANAGVALAAPRAARSSGSRVGPTPRPVAARSVRVPALAAASSAAVRTSASKAAAAVAAPAGASVAAGVAPSPAAASQTPLRAAAAVIAGATAPTAAATATAAEQFPVIHGIVTAVDRFLTNTANWLYTLPANPLTDLLQGGLYLIRRALFPSSVGVITAPIQVPLYFATIDSGAQKVGIYASLGGGAPQFFEFDTGGKGFYATYASSDPEFSPWWGDAVKTSSTAIQNTYDSGLEYQGYAANTTVSLFAAPGSAMPLLTTGVSTVGQIDSITADPTTYWSPTGATTPPVDGVFWGDFGMAPNYAANQVSSLIGQLTFACGVLPGYRIHIDPGTQTAWMQVGLTNADTQNPAGLYFNMNLDPDAPQGATVPNSGLRYYGEQLFNAAVSIGTAVTDSNLGITPDTGASTTVHNIPSTERAAYDQVVTWEDPQTKVKGKVNKDLDFSLRGLTTTGTPATFFDFKTTEKVNDGQVKVQNQGIETSVYYLNTGIALFFDYDVVYYLGTPQGGGTLGLI